MNTTGTQAPAPTTGCILPGTPHVIRCAPGCDYFEGHAPAWTEDATRATATVRDLTLTATQTETLRWEWTITETARPWISVMDGSALHLGAAKNQMTIALRDIARRNRKA